MRIAFVNPPFKPEHGRFSREQRSPAITKGGTFYYPMWLCYAAGVAEEAGHEIRVIDAPATRQDTATVLQALRTFSPGLVVVDTSTPSIVSDAQMADRIQEETGAFVVLVGTHPTALPEQTMALGSRFQAIARREYEYTIRDLAALLEQGTPSPDALQAVDGLTVRAGETVCHAPDRAPVEDLDALPFVSRVYQKHLDVTNYFYTIAQHPEVALVSGRGCPYGCVYCVYPQVMHGRGYRKRSVENLVEEFRFIQTEMPHVREVFLEDDTFTVDKARVQAFSRLYRDAGLRLRWIANSRADVDLETLQAAKACGCRLLCVGFESGDQSVLDAMGKGLQVEQARRFAADARQAGILIHGCFLVGNPGETKETLETTLAYAKELKPDTAQFFPIMVYPGTAAYGWAREKGYLLTEDFSRWNTDEGLHNCVVSRPGLSNDELVAWCDRARRAYYLRFGYIAYRLWRLARHPIEDGPRMLKSMKVFWRFLWRGTGRT